MLKRFSILFLFALLISPVLFAAETTAEKPTTLPADGGEPGKAYMAYTKAFASGDIAALKKMVSADRAKQLDDPQMKEMLPMMQALQPKDIKITGGTMTSKEATLNAEGKAEGATEKQTGTIHMILEDKTWKVEKESWKSGMQ
ncbi:MAG TPA: hypothetical protein VLH08_00045 [Acidobacteriota bacterium]|nr:hypothetical protein [Acidobacteriota bacterium]